MRFLRAVVMGSALAGLLSSNHLVAQSGDKFLGTWKLNVAQSKYSPAGPKALTVTIAKAGAGFSVMAMGTAADGSAMHSSYTAALDGKDAIVTGTPDYDAVNVKMLDANTRHMVRKKGGKEVQTVHSVLSADGKHFTSTTTGVNAKGEKVNSTAVFDKQ